MAKRNDDIWAKQYYLIDVVTADVSDRFYTKMLEQDTLILNDYMSNPQGVDIDDLTAYYTQLVFATIESIMQRMELTTAQQNSLTNKVTKICNDYLADEAVLIDFIRQPEKVVELISRLANEAVEQLGDKVIDKLEVPAGTNDNGVCFDDYQTALPDVFPRG